MAGQPEFNQKLSEMTSDILTCGVFGPGIRGIWKYGRDDDEFDRAP